MKHAKKLLALLLTLALALTLALPAFAEDEPPEEPNPAMPVITVQPQSVRVRVNETFTLSVEAYIPNGDEIGYRWSGYGLGYTPKDTKELTYTFGSWYQGTYEYTVEVFNLNNPELIITSEIAVVEAYQTFRDRIEYWFAAALWGFWFFGGPFILVPLMPFVWIYNWIRDILS